MNLDLKFITTIFRNFWSKIIGQPRFWKKNWKIIFFSIFPAKLILFLYEIEFYMKNAFLWCIICWYRSKIAKFWNFTNFLAIFGKIFIFRIFMWFVGKKFQKRLKSVGNYPNLCENKIFDLLVAPEQRNYLEYMGVKLTLPLQET